MKRCIAIVLAIIFVASPAHAYRLYPLEATLSPGGAEARFNFQLTNTNSIPVAIELRAYHRSMDVDGQDWLEDAADDFLIFPSQVVLMPGEERAIRVQYVGPPVIADEQAYRLIAEQLPIKLSADKENNGGAMMFLVRYVASLYVRPKTSSPDIQIVAAEKDEEGRVWLLLANAGNAHAQLRRFTVGNKFDQEKLPSLAGVNILGGISRRFQVPELDITQAQSLVGQALKLH